MKKTIGWAAVGNDGRISTDWFGLQIGPSAYTEKFHIFAYPGPGLVRVEIRESREKERKTKRSK